MNNGGNDKASLKEKVGKLLREIIVGLIIAIGGAAAGGLITYHFTALNIEQATVELMARRIAIIDERDTLEEAVKKAAEEIDDKEADIQEKDDEIETLTAQLEAERAGDSAEITELNSQLEEKDTEISGLTTQISEKDKEISDKKAEIDRLNEELRTLKEKGYEAYIIDTITSTPVSLASLEHMRNDHVRTDNAGDVSVDGTSIGFYFDTDYSGLQGVEYSLNGKYSKFTADVYISQDAYKKYDSDSSRLKEASVTIQVKYSDSDDYQTKKVVSGLIADSAPTSIDVDLMGATRIKILFNGVADIIRVGNPYLYRIVS